MSGDLHQEIGRLRAQVSDLQERVRVLSEIPQEGVLRLQQRFHLKKTAAAILLSMADGHVRSQSWLAARCIKPSADVETVKVHISNIRKALHPLKIITHTGHGYALAPNTSAAVRAVIKGTRE